MNTNNHLFFDFLDYYQTNVKSINDLKICKTILDHINEIDTLDITTLAKRSGSSIASVSRFVHLFEVKNYKEFTQGLKDSYLFLKPVKQIHLDNLDQYGIEGILKNERDHAIENVDYTMKHLDLQKIDTLCSMLLEAKSITFVGANHSLEIVSELQILLNGLDIPTYIYKQVERLNGHLALLDKDDLVVFISVGDRYQNIHGNQQLLKLKKNKIKTVMIAQNQVSNSSLYNEIIYYGIENSRNDGCYSLDMLIKIIERVLLLKL